MQRQYALVMGTGSGAAAVSSRQDARQCGRHPWWQGQRTVADVEVCPTV